MNLDLEQTCTACSRKFWLMSIEDRLFDYICESRTGGFSDAQIHRALVDHGWPQAQLEETILTLAVDRCPACRSAADPGEVSTGLATLEQLRNNVPAGVDERNQSLEAALSNEADIARELRYWVNEAYIVYDVPEPTLLQRITGRGNDARRREERRRREAQLSVEGIIAQEKAMLKAFKKVQIARMETEAEITRSRNELLEAQLETLELEEQIEQQQALRAQRLKTQYLEESRKQTLLLREMGQPFAPELEDRAQRFIREQRQAARMRADVKQALISDFLEEIGLIYDTDLSDGEKAIRIRVVMEAYKQEMDALPKVIREFLEDVEDGEVVNHE